MSVTYGAYEFLPGRGTHYGSKIRSFVLRNQRVRKRKKSITGANIYDEPLSSLSRPCQVVGSADPTTLSVGRLDPFDTLAAPLDSYENNMLQRYLHCCIPNLGKNRSNECFFPPRDIDWLSIRGDGMLMSAAIQFAALSFALIESQERGHTEDANKYHGKTLQLVRRRLEAERLKPTDELLHVIIGLLATDTHIRRCKHTSAEIEQEIDLHIRGLQAALECRHGWNISGYSSILQWEFLWQNVVVGSRIAAGKTIFSAHLQRVLPMNNPLHVGSSFKQQWNRLCVLEFIGAYTNFYKAAQQRIRTPPKCNKRLSPELRELYLPGTKAYEVMISDEWAVVGPIVPILLVNIVLYSLREADAEETAYQYWALHKKFRRCDVERGTGPAYLCFATGMTVDMRTWTEPQQMELLARMAGVESKMSKKSQKLLKSSLLGFITGEGVENQADWWAPDDLRARMREEVEADV